MFTPWAKNKSKKGQSHHLQLPGFDLTVIAEEFRLTQSVIKWKANYDPPKEWGSLPPIW
jgi:hypothetical protein